MKLKVKCEIKISGVVEIPDSWADPEEMESNPNFPLDVADYHYNEKMDEGEALEALISTMVQSEVEINFSYLED